ncbi:hypothetical protein BDW22DRAFT_554900 [Trametopsis cervina]|nr:hypothetical protein BDW22DRAFT_554900 [Trametopsis cervina]
MDFTRAKPGTSAYFPSLVNRIRDAHPELPLDPVILQSILLCLVAANADGSGDDGSAHHRGRKNLVLRTREEDIGLVLNLAHLLVSSQIPSVALIIYAPWGPVCVC